MRVVLDANVLISAVIQAGPSYRIVSRWLDEAGLDVVICPAVLAEVEKVLRRPMLRTLIDQ
jgi:predicted nucleic acid-binding protein